MTFPKISTLDEIKEIETADWNSQCAARSTYDLFRANAEKFRSKTAITYLPKGDGTEDGVRITYDELFARITQTANVFHALGVGQDDVISYILPNFPETYEVIWGGQAAGIINAINPFLEPETIEELIRAAGSKILVTCPPIPGLDLMARLFEIADECAHVEAVLIVDPAIYFNSSPITCPPATPGGKPVYSFQSERSKQDSERLVSERVIEPNDLAALFHTGGTTGTPKLTPLTHENLVFTSWVTPRTLNFAQNDSMFIGLPLFHINSVVMGLNSFTTGATVLLVTPLGFRTPGVIENAWKIVDQHSASILSGVPTIYTALMDVPIDSANISSFKVAICGAAPLSPETFRRFQEYSGVELLEGYGMTETTCSASFNPVFGDRRIGSIGLRLPFTEMRCAIVRNGAVERFCDTDEVGTIVMRGPHIFPGYYRRVPNGLLEDGWLDSGDLGRQDADGYFWLTGRSKDLIIRGGHNIDPSMIENTLAKRADVALVAAIGQPDSYAGELPCVYIQLTPSADTSADEIQAWAKANIPERAAAPVYVEVLEAMPVTAVGKVFKPELRIMATHRILSQSLQEANIQATVDVYQDEKRGIVARVLVPASAQKNTSDVLGHFAVQIDVTVDA